MQRASSWLITKKQKNAKNQTPSLEKQTEIEKRTSKENVDERCTSSHENKTFRSRSVVKQKGMVFGFRKTATAVTRPER